MSDDKKAPEVPQTPEKPKKLKKPWKAPQVKTTLDIQSTSGNVKRVFSDSGNNSMS